MKDKLNSTFLNELKQEAERFTWFKSSGKIANGKSYKKRKL